jgi:hypothetical protein
MGIIVYPKRWSFEPPVGAEIQQGHPLTQGLTHLFLINEDGGPTLYNLTNQAQGNCVLTGTVVSNSVMGSSRTFNGTTDNGLVSYPSVTPTAITVEAWVAQIATGSFPEIYSNDMINSRAELRWNGSGSLPEFIRNSDSAQATTPVTLGKLYHLVGTADNARLNLYVNGVLAASVVQNTALAATTLYRVGCRGNGTQLFANMQLSLLSVRNVALSASQVLNLYEDPYCYMQPQSPQRRYWVAPAAAASATVFRKQLSTVGTRVGSRQVHL